MRRIWKDNFEDLYSKDNQEQDIVHMCGFGEKIECRNNRGISLLSMVGEVFTGILVDRVRRVSEGLIDDM